MAVQEGTCDKTPFPLSHCYESFPLVTEVCANISAVGRNRPFFSISKLTETIFGPFP
jgi:hypothetical protein